MLKGFATGSKGENGRFDGDGAIARVGIGCCAIKRDAFRAVIYGRSRIIHTRGRSFSVLSVERSGV